jgi:hypothetical protein
LNYITFPFSILFPQRKQKKKRMTTNTLAPFSAGTAERLIKSADALDFALQGMYHGLKVLLDD